MNMNATTKSKANNKVSVVLLAVAALYGLATILVLYSGFLTFPPILETTDDIKYAIGFFYVPLVTVVLALGAFVQKMRAAGSRKLSEKHFTRFRSVSGFPVEEYAAWQ